MVVGEVEDEDALVEVGGVGFGVGVDAFVSPVNEDMTIALFKSICKLRI